MEEYILSSSAFSVELVIGETYCDGIVILETSNGNHFSLAPTKAEDIEKLAIAYAMQNINLNKIHFSKKDLTVYSQKIVGKERIMLKENK